MKKALLFAILALSINAFAQNKQPASNFQHPTSTIQSRTSNALKNVQDRMADRGMKTSGINSEENLGLPVKHQALKQSSLIQLFDSIYDWRWDTVNMGWKVNYKTISMDYNANNRLIHSIEQDWTGSAWENDHQFFATYDANDFTKSESYKYWNSVGTELESGDSTSYYFHTGAVGINDFIVREISIHVYPNPSSGKFTISGSSIISFIEIYNILGERIYSDFDLKRQTVYDIDLLNIGKGIYFIKIFNEGKAQTERIIVQ
ncbi:MAG: T9SS C-terminal target domain-containing protein [Porphyromonadaceae bacterium]|nr:MAG: T9SS C-terminal target domain-containing protein [Porphyromonadaceae bacterium]